MSFWCDLSSFIIYFIEYTSISCAYMDKAKLQVEEIDASLTPNAEVSHEA